MVQLAPGGRQGRQQGGDTYTLEIAFPAVKYVCFIVYGMKTCTIRK